MQEHHPWGVLALAAAATILLAGCGASLNSADWQKRILALNGVQDQAVLAKVALEDPSPSVRKAAVAKLTDARVLARVAAKKEEGQDTRKAALAKVTDQAVLAGVATNREESPATREAAVANMTDQAVLADLATGAEGAVQLAAIAKLADDELLARLAMRHENGQVRQAAVDRMTDPALLMKLADSGPELTRQAARARVGYDAVLLARILDDPGIEHGKEIEALQKQESLERVAAESFRARDRDKAAALLTDPAAQKRVASRKEHVGAWVAALRAGATPQVLRLTALECRLDLPCYAAAEHLADPAVLEEVAVTSPVREVLGIVLAKIEDATALGRISERAVDPALRRAAALKGRKTTWAEAFTAALDSSAPSALTDVLDTVELYPSEAKAGAWEACREAIRWGLESRIPGLVQLLDLLGNKDWALLYLNSGQPQLEAAARSWAKSHDYEVRELTETEAWLRSKAGGNPQGATWGDRW